MPPKVHEFVTRDLRTLKLLALADRLAKTEVSLLILGESGTGKELLARRIHYASERSKGPLFCVNCGALQETLLLSELFGHEKGAFTGAFAQKKGWVELTSGGTLFLDEIGEMGLEAQAKLLRFLQDGEIFRVGGSTPIKTDVRVVSATNRDLQARVKQGLFRQDLFYRINAVSLSIAPLRERPDDIEFLLQHFLSFSNAAECRIRRFDEESLARLRNYAWPGNVRELFNVFERLKVLVDEPVVRISHLPENIRSGESGHSDSLEQSLLLEEVERRHIHRVLEMYQGNKTQAARALGITAKTLYNKLAKYEEVTTPN